MKRLFFYFNQLIVFLSCYGNRTQEQTPPSVQRRRLFETIHIPSFDKIQTVS